MLCAAWLCTRPNSRAAVVVVVADVAHHSYEKAIALGLRVEEEVERPKGFHRGFSGASHGDDIQAVAGELARKLASPCHAAGSDTTTSPDTVTQAQFTAWAARVLRQ